MNGLIQLIFELSIKDANTEVKFTQEGVVPEYECYNICFDSWGNYKKEQRNAYIGLKKKRFRTSITQKKKFSLYLMIVFYTITGINHFLHTEFYIKIMPHWLPYHNQLVFISGAFEVLFALLLVFSFTRRIGLWCIILLLIAVFPANIQMMLNYFEENNKHLWIAILRLPFQIILILWAYGLLKSLNNTPSDCKKRIGK